MLKTEFHLRLMIAEQDPIDELIAAIILAATYCEDIPRRPMNFTLAILRVSRIFHLA